MVAVAGGTSWRRPSISSCYSSVFCFSPWCGRIAVRSSAECRAARSIIDPLLWAQARNVRQAHAKVSTYIPNTQIYVHAVNSCLFPLPASTCMGVSCIDVDLPFRLSWTLWLLLVPYLPCKPLQDLRLSKIQPVYIQNSVPCRERTACTLCRLLLLFRETIAVLCENHSKHINTPFWQRAGAGGMYNYHRILKFKVLYSSTGLEVTDRSARKSWGYERSDWIKYTYQMSHTRALFSIFTRLRVSAVTASHL